MDIGQAQENIKESEKRIFEFINNEIKKLEIETGLNIEIEIESIDSHTLGTCDVQKILTLPPQR